MLNFQLIDSHGSIQSGSEQLISQWKNQQNNALLWIDCHYESLDEANSLLTEFQIHPLAIEDALRTRHPPKIEFFDEQLFILYRGISKINGPLDFTHQQIALFIAKDFIISLHPKPSPGIEKTIEHLGELKQYTPLNIALKIMRNASSLYLENILDFETQLSDLEDDLHHRGSDALLGRLTLHKSKLLKLIRGFNYHTAISKGLLNEGDEYDFLNYEQHMHTINDLNDRFDRLATLSQMHYDICSDLIDGYLSISAHQLNETMRVLTVITAIFVPLGFLAGLYGMNFDYIPELKFEGGYFYLLGTMSFIAFSLLYFFKRKRWL
jgi:magnesium transporter